MKGLLSLTTRLSIMFGLTMLGIWILVSVLLLHTLGHHFDKQDDTEITGKLQLATNFLSAHIKSGAQDWSSLNRQLNDALLGHHSLYILILDPQGQVLADIHPPGSSQPGMTWVNGRRGLTPGSIENWRENGTVFRSVTEQLVPGSAGKQADLPPYFLVRATIDTSYHQHFINEIKNGLYWFTLGIGLISLFLGWLASRIGLKPLRELASVSKSVTASQLDQRLALDNAPSELYAPIQAFNTMLDRLEASFQRLSEFSSDIAHELRTPVNSLMMQTQVALTHPRDAEDYKEVLYANLETAERLARMIGEMLFLAKSEQGQLAMQREPLVLADELDELMEFFEPLASEQLVRLQRQGNANLLGDRSMLQRAFSNLLANAIRYTQAQGEVRIAIHSDSTGIIVEVANPGPAIPPEQWPRLFDRFYRADSARQSVTEGTGLGLAIAKAIITAHDGTLSVHSDERETCFTAHFARTNPSTATG
ncbi:heavy metal sensor histidine kinase [Oceanisphaera arctica]|uniref:Sensor protein n=1 Tax=Oceanisphaera arctica TaxID=641510 RepID=A0A2P5TR57_9GAMM|nr:heavy metal sensor histidine kinase [Oceanisphaera arctica]PPL18225.1 two-component sensor histidine kinase [Oceanisphaera arctica]